MPTTAWCKFYAAGCVKTIANMHLNNLLKSVLSGVLRRRRYSKSVLFFTTDRTSSCKYLQCHVPQTATRQSFNHLISNLRKNFLLHKLVELWDHSFEKLLNCIRHVDSLHVTARAGSVTGTMRMHCYSTQRPAAGLGQSD